VRLLEASARSILGAMLAILAILVVDSAFEGPVLVEEARAGADGCQVQLYLGVAAGVTEPAEACVEVEPEGDGDDAW
jgi:hypothetical protein